MDAKPLGVFRAKVNESGQLAPFEVGRYAGLLSRLKGKVVEIRIGLERKEHTRSQRGWYRAAICPEVAAFLSEAKGYAITPDQAHELLKRTFIGVIETPLGEVAISTKTLDTAQFSTYCEQIRAYAASEWGLHIQSPDDYWSRKSA